MTLVVTPAALMWCASQVAKRDGISVQAVTRKVRHLAEKHGLTIERDSRGRIVAFNIAQYDHLRNRYADPSKAQVASAPSMDGTADSYDEALRQKTWIEAERARLKLDEERGELVRRAELADAAAQCGERIARMAYRFVNSADEHTAIAVKDGANGLRAAYKVFVRKFCTDVAEAMSSCRRHGTRRRDAAGGRFDAGRWEGATT